MGTNYYAVSKNTNTQPIHIGKSSYGWLFLFHKTDQFSNYEEVQEWLQKHTSKKNSKYKIIDENGTELNFQEFLDIVNEKQIDPFNLENPDNFKYCDNINGYRFSSEDFL